MTLSTKNDVRRSQAANSLERYVVKWFGKDLNSGNQTAKHGTKLTRAGALSIDCVVYQVNEQRLLQAVKLSVESADIDATVEYRGRRVDIITNLNCAEWSPVFG